MSPTSYELQSLDKRDPQTRPVRIMSFAPETISCRALELTDICLISVFFLFTMPLNNFPLYFLTLLSANITEPDTESFLNELLYIGLDSLCERLVYLIAINWCSARFKQYDGQTLAVSHCVDL